MDRDDVRSAGLTAIGIVAGTVARAVALGGRLVAAGLETIESALRGGEETSGPGTRNRPSPSTARSAVRSTQDSDEGTREASDGFAPLPDPAFEPADGITAPARPARSAIRRSSAGATARTTPGPRPAKRATAKSLPPNLRPVEPREATPEAAPVKGAAGGADAAAVPPAKAAKGTAKKAARKATTAKATAQKGTARKAIATRATAKKTADATAKKATAKKTATTKAPAEQAPATHSAESAHTRPEGSSDSREGSAPQA